MSGERFARRWALLLALLAALIFASPFLVRLLDRNAACFGTEHACSDMAEVFAAHGRAVVLAIALIPLLVTIAARALTLGAALWAIPFALLMIAGALPLLWAIGSPQIDGWDDLLGHPGIVPLLFLLVMLLALSGEGEDGIGGMWQVATPLVAFVTLFLTFAAWLPGVAMLPVLGAAAAPTGAWFVKAHGAIGIAGHGAALVNLCLLAFVLAAAGMLMSGRARSGR